MKYKSVTNRQSGFSLLEVLITVAIIATAMIALAKFQGALFENSSLAKNRTTALGLASQKMSELRADLYDNLASGETTIGPNELPGLVETYTITWAVNNNPDLQNLQDIQVQVTWLNRNGAVTDDTTVTLQSDISSSADELSLVLTTDTPEDILEDTQSTDGDTPDVNTDPNQTTDPDPTTDPDLTTDPDSTTDPDPVSYRCSCRYDSALGEVTISTGGTCCTLAFCTTHLPYDPGFNLSYSPIARCVE